MTNSIRVDKLHIAMLKRLRFGSEDGVPSVDPKRPYGNKDLLYDLVEIYNADLGCEIVKIEDGGFLLLDGDRVVARGGQSEDDIFDEDETKEQDLALKLYAHHREMATVLSILVQELSIQEGIYTKNDFWNPETWAYQGDGESTGGPFDGSKSLHEFAKEQKADWTEDQKAVYSAAAQTFSDAVEEHRASRGPRRVAVAIASSVPLPEQDYVDLLLDRHILADDQVLLDPENYNNRLIDYLKRKNIPHTIGAVRLNRVDQVLAIFDPSMRTDNEASDGPRSLQLWAQDNGIQVIQEEASPAGTPIRATREVK